MTILARIQREPAKLLAFATAILAVLTGTGVLTETGATIALGVVAASIGLLSYIVTPAGEVVAQQLPGGALLAGRASITEPGTPLASVGVTPIDPEPEVFEERGASTGELVLIIIGVVALLYVLWTIVAR